MDNQRSASCVNHAPTPTPGPGRMLKPPDGPSFSFSFSLEEAHEHIRADRQRRRAAGPRRAPHTTLLHWLRDQGLTGCKEGCAEGECGACAVLVARPDGEGADTRWESVNACLVTLAALSGQEVVTAEGLGSPADLHPVQRELAGRGGSQCGYCTPGFVTSMAAEYYRERTPRTTAPPTASTCTP